MDMTRLCLSCVLAFLVYGDLVTSTENEWNAGRLYNSSVACTRGSQQTVHDIDCRNTQPQGMVGRMYISRIFYGTTPLTMGCNRTASYNSCCTMNPNADCIFASDVDIEDIARRFTGLSQATFRGARRYTSLGNCDPKIYPDLTSFSFVEFGCASVSFLKDITSDVSFQYPEVVYLDSNGYFNNSKVKDSEFDCVVQTECNLTVSVNALHLRLYLDNSNRCPEEFFFQDGKYPDVKGNVSCADGTFMFNRVLFTSESNVAIIRMSVTGNHTGRVFLKVYSSEERSDIKLTCGSETSKILENLEPCQGDIYIGESSLVTASSSQATSTSATATGWMYMSTNTTEVAKIGLIIGLAVGIPVLLLLLIILFCFVRQRRQPKPVEKPETHHSTMVCSESPSKVTMSTCVEHTFDLPIIGSGIYPAPPPYTEINEEVTMSHGREKEREYTQIVN